jgi:hypothetical protein
VRRIVKVTRTPVRVTRFTYRYHQVCSWVLMGLAVAVEVVLVINPGAPWWGWLVVLALIVMSAWVKFHVSVRVSFNWRKRKK